MTKQLSDFFNLDPIEPEETPVANLPSESVELVPRDEVISEELTIADRIDQALPKVRGLEAEDRSFDEYADLAMDSYKRLMDLGFNVDDRNAGTIFDVANKMMGNAIAAKTAKLDKKLKMIELQLKAARLEKPTEKVEEATEAGITTDRNAILNLINQNLKNKDK